jgi:hypothetical protein
MRHESAKKSAANLAALPNQVKSLFFRLCWPFRILGRHTLKELKTEVDNLRGAIG